MGGSKKKSPSQQEKTQNDNSKTGKKSKKSKEKSSSSKAEITVILTDEQAEKLIKGSKFITVLELAKKAGVKASAANSYLKRASAANKIRRVGGHSGHWIYATGPSLSTSPATSVSSSSA